MKKRTFLRLLGLGLTLSPYPQQVYARDWDSKAKFWGRPLTEAEDKLVCQHIEQGQLLFMRDKDAKGAVQEYYKALRIAPECPYLYRTIGNFFVALGDYSKAKVNTQYALKLSEAQGNRWENTIAKQLIQEIALLQAKQPIEEIAHIRQK